MMDAREANGFHTMNARFRWLWAAVLAAAVAGVALWYWRAPLQETWHMAVERIGNMRARPAKPDPQTYAVLKSDLERWRLDLADRYQKAHTAAEREAVEHDARVILETALPSMMRCWLGTPWDFNGTATQPGGGKIACGYYVATVITQGSGLTATNSHGNPPATSFNRSSPKTPAS